MEKNPFYTKTRVSYIELFLATTNKGDAIFDPFLGTGTTAVVAKKLGRKYFGIERDKKYFKAANERIKKTKVIEDEYLDTIENNKSKPRIPWISCGTRNIEAWHYPI